MFDSPSLAIGEPRGAAICRRQGRQYLARGLFDRAHQALEHALGQAPGAGGRPSRGRTHTELAAVCWARRQFDPAVAETLDALRLLDPRDDLYYNRAVYTMALALGRRSAVKPRYRRLLEENRRRRCRRRGLRWTQHRYLEGLVSKSRHHHDRALVTLEGAWRRFLTLRSARDRAVVGVDLVDLHLLTGIREDALRVAVATADSLRSLGARLSAFRALEARLDGGGPVDDAVRRAREVLLAAGCRPGSR